MAAHIQIILSNSIFVWKHIIYKYLFIEAVNLCRNGDSVTVFGSDTDLVMMMMHFWKPGMGDLILRSEYTRNKTKHLKQLEIEKALSKINRTVKPYLLLIHAFGGCDTTSAIQDKGKAAILNLIQNSKEARTLADLFMDPESSREQIGKAGIRLFVLLYKGKACDSLADLRYNLYMKMAATAQKIDPSKLPPTEDTAIQHSLRVYLQVWQWKSFQERNIDPVEWGWQVKQGRMTPVMTTKV